MMENKSNLTSPGVLAIYLRFECGVTVAHKYLSASTIYGKKIIGKIKNAPLLFTTISIHKKKQYNKNNSIFPALITHNETIMEAT